MLAVFASVAYAAAAPVFSAIFDPSARGVRAVIPFGLGWLLITLSATLFSCVLSRASERAAPFAEAQALL